MGRRPIPCTADALEEVRVGLVAQIEAARTQVESGLHGRLGDVEQRLRADVLKVRQDVDQLDNIKIEESCTKVAERVGSDLARSARDLRAEIEALRPVISTSVLRIRADLERQLAERDVGTRDAFAVELESLCGHFDQELDTIRVGLEELNAQRAAEATEALEKERLVAQAAEEARQAAATATAEAQRAASEELQRAVEAQDKVDKRQDLKAKAMQSDSDLKFMQLESQMKEAAETTAKALEGAVAVAAAKLAEINAAAGERFEAVAEQLERLRGIFSDVENVPTRRVDWVIREAARRLRVPDNAEDGTPPPAYGSWLSPPFDAAGAHDLRLEVRVFRQLDPPAEGQDKGDCAVLLHAPKGTYVAFRLSVGAASEPFEHKFDGEGAVGTQRLCFFAEHISSLNGSLRVGVEILECIYELERKALPPQVAAEGEGDLAPALEGSFRLQRHVNNRILDMVKVQMDYFKNRMTRRVEWRLEQASMMRRSFPRGTPMRSKEFSAAGIDGMQFVFYPSGYDSAGEGFCSAFLCAPAGATLCCWLQVGAERRDINHTFDKSGQIGRANFCRWEGCFNAEEDTVLLALEIQEAHVDLVAAASHAPPPAAGLRSLVREAAPPVPIGSIIKLQRMADFLPPILQEVKVLPSLWAAKNTHDAAVRVEGLRPLREVRSRGGRPRSGARRSPSSPLLH